MEELRQKLYNCIEQYGNLDERTVTGQAYSKGDGKECNYYLRLNKL